MPIGNIWSGISFRHDDSIFVALAEPCTLAAKDDPLGNGEPTVMQGWKIFEMGSELFLRNFGLPSFRSKNKA